MDKQKALGPDAETAGVSVVPDCGLAPGMVNILAQGGIDAMEETGPAESQPMCQALSELGLWIDVRLGLSPESWDHYHRFLAVMEKRHPEFRSLQPAFLLPVLWSGQLRLLAWPQKTNCSHPAPDQPDFRQAESEESWNVGYGSAQR